MDILIIGVVLAVLIIPLFLFGGIGSLETSRPTRAQENYAITVAVREFYSAAHSEDASKVKDGIKRITERKAWAESLTDANWRQAYLKEYDWYEKRLLERLEVVEMNKVTPPNYSKGY